MDTRELQKLAEAYNQVHTPQEVDEAVKGASPHTMQMRKDAAAERRAGIKPLSAKKGEEYAKYKMSQMAYAKRAKMGEEVEQIDEVSYSAKAARAGKDIGKPGKAFAKIAKSAGERYGSKERGEKVAGAVLAKLRKEDFDIFDIVLEFLQAEGFAETLEEAQWLMANVIDEEAIDIILGEGHGSRTSFKSQSAAERGRINMFKGSKIEYTPHKNYDPEANRGQGQILRPNQAEKQRRKKLAQSAMGEDYVNEAQHARENPETHDKEEKRKYEPVRGERTPMPPRGDKRREDFEKWYAKNVR
jgi:hypothetical protein